MNPYTEEKMGRWKQRLVFLQICKGRKSGDEKTVDFLLVKKWVDFLPKSGREENWKMEKNGWFLPIYLEGRKRELKDGEKRKIFCPDLEGRGFKREQIDEKRLIFPHISGREEKRIDRWRQKEDFLPMQEEGFLSSSIWEKGSYESGAGSVPWQFTVNSAAENKNEKSRKES